MVQFYNVYLDNAEPFNGSIQDNGSGMGPVTYQPGRNPVWDWKQIPGREARYIELDSSNSNILFTAGYYGRGAFVLDDLTTIRKSEE